MIGLPDEYTLRARVAPALIVITPGVVYLAASAVIRARVAAVASLVGVAIAVLAAQLARDAGKRLEVGLWESWGGSPTLRRLRFRDASDTEVVERRHLQAEALLKRQLPSQAEEAADPDRADAVYEAATLALRERTRDTKRFGILFAENMDYGFRRNLLGLRPWGIGVAVATIGASVALGLLPTGTTEGRVLAAGIPGATGILSLTLLAFVVSPSWVRVPAEAYADRLFGALDVLASEAI